ncbi:hypothetical protein WJX74_002752 [Apatococcus lobatus]|uniref:Uncharacterized protein n=1 Tax=Apatococcus lobatus TaxID=904363 RepID=A0AAW1RPM0_9CHLO
MSNKPPAISVRTSFSSEQDKYACRWRGPTQVRRLATAVWQEAGDDKKPKARAVLPGPSVLLSYIFFDKAGHMQQAVRASFCPSCVHWQQSRLRHLQPSLHPLQERSEQTSRRQCMRAIPSAQVLPRKTPEWKPPGDIPNEPGRVPPDYSPPGEKPGMPSSPPEFTPPDQAPASPTVPESDPPMRPLPPDESPKTPEVPVPERDPYKPLPGREPERRTEESPAVEPQIEPQPLREK